MRSRWLGRALGAAFVAVAALGLVIAQFTVPRKDGAAGSAEGLGPEGRRVLALFLAELGLETRTFDALPTELVARVPEEHALLWSARVPADSLVARVAPEGDAEGEGDRADEEAGEAREAGEAGEDGEDGEDGEAREDGEEAPSSPAAGEEGRAAPDEGAARPRELAGAPAALQELERRRAEGYRAFVERGGTWILPAGPRAEVYLAERLGLAEHARAARLAPPRGEEQPSTLGPDGARYRLEPALARHLAEPDALRGARPLIVDEGGRTFAVALPLGRGELVLLADDAFLDNGDALAVEEPTTGLGAADGALLVARVLESVRLEGPVLLDEYALGRWRPPTPWSFALAPDLRLLTVQVVAWIALGLLALAWPRAFPRDPRGLETLSPLERARARARLVARAGRHDLLGLELRRGALATLARAGGVRPRADASPRAGEPLDPEEVERVLAPLARTAPELAADWGAWLRATPERGRGALERDGRALAALEGRTAEHHGRRALERDAHGRAARGAAREPLVPDAEASARAAASASDTLARAKEESA